jgi:hypothetical protein
MFGWLFGRWRNQSREYLEPGRLEDVIALIQLLGLDEYVHREENAIHKALTGAPSSADTWCDIGRRHPEFFRVFGGRESDSVALIARHLTGNSEERPVLSPEYIRGLVLALIAILPSLGTVIAAWLNRSK